MSGKKLFLLLTFFMIHAGAYSSSQGCHKVFIIVLVQKVFSNPESYERYRGQKGYLLFMREKTPNASSMDYVFSKVSKALGEDFKRLGWQKFYGSVKEFHEIRKLLLDKRGGTKEEYQGREGYARFAEEHYAGGMFRAFLNASSVLSKAVFKKLDWQAFKGSVEEFYKIRKWLLDERGRIKEEYKGREGYAHFATKHYAGDMLKAFINVSSALSQEVFKKSGWQAFQGLVEEFYEIRKLLLDERGEIKEEYKGMAGYAHFSEEHYASDMFRAFINASSALSQEVFKKSGWQQFRGSVEEFHEIRKLLLDEKAEIKEEYQGMDGYIRFSEEHYAGDMFRAFINASSVLSKEVLKKSGWQAFKGSVREFHEIRKLLLDEKAEIKEEYQGRKGYARFAEDHYAGDMFKAFMNTSSVLSKEVFKKLGWKAFYGSVEEFKSLSNRILDEEGRIKEEYKGRKGYARFAEDHYAGDMLQAFKNTSSVLSKEVLKKSGWQEFHGSVEEFYKIREWLLDKEGRIKEEYQGREGYAHFATKHYGGDMFRAFLNASSVLSKEFFKKLGWQAFHGSVEEFYKIREWLVDEKGELKEEYQGMAGYAHFATKHYGGDMSKTFLNASSVLSKEIFRKSGWQDFLGSVEEFYQIRAWLVDEKGELKEEYKGMKGCARFAEEHYAGDMFKAFVNVSSVLGGFRNIREWGLGWKTFRGTAGQFHALVRFFENNRTIKFQGPEGLKTLADKIFKGHQKNTYRNVSALRDFLPIEGGFKALHWPVVR